MDRFQAMQVFTRVVDANSFTRAAETLGLPRATVTTIIQNLEVGLVILDEENRIQVWNGFMESHSSQLSYQVKDKNLFELYPDFDRPWLERKLSMVRTLNNKAFISWEQRPWLFRFSN